MGNVVLAFYHIFVLNRGAIMNIAQNKSGLPPDYALFNLNMSIFWQ